MILIETKNDNGKFFDTFSYKLIGDSFFYRHDEEELINIQDICDWKEKPEKPRKLDLSHLICN